MYDAFISYSHALDMPVAAALQGVIQTLGKPWWKRRMCRVFRDDASLSANPNLWNSIETALRGSRFFILLASPQAARSYWVAREVETWLAEKGPAALLIALTEGELAWDASAGDFSWTDTTPLPAILRRVFADEPLWVDLRAYRMNVREGGTYTRGFLSAGAALAASIRHTPKEDLLSEEATQQRRNMMWAQVAALALLALATAAVWQAGAALRAQTLAEAQRDRAERVLDQVAASANRRVLALAVKVGQLEPLFAGDHKPAPTDMPDGSQSDGDQQLNRVRELLDSSSWFLANGDALQALRVADHAIVVLKQRVDSEGAPTDWRFALIGAYDRLSRAAVIMGQRDQVEAALQNGLATARALAMEVPLDEAAIRSVAWLNQNMGDWLLYEKQTDEAERLYKEALAIRTSVAAVPGASLDAKREFVISIGRMGDVQLARGNADEAIEKYTNSIRLIDELVMLNPSDAALRHDLSVIYQRMADALSKAGKPEDALLWIKRDVEIADTLLASADADPVRLHDLASSYDRLARAQEALDQMEAALKTYEKAYETLKLITARNPRASAWHRDEAGVLETLGKLLLRLQNPDRAIEAFRRALSIREALAASFEQQSWQIELESAYRRTSELMSAMGRPQDAFETAEHYLLATALAPDTRTDKPERVARALGTLCWHALLAGNVARSVWAGNQGLMLMPGLDWVKLNYAHALMFSGETENARAIYLKGLARDDVAASAWKVSIRRDFDDFRKRNMKSKLMVEIASRVGVETDLHTK
jgi:tetratricopeptide (TPR) repeat protein